MVLTPQLLQAIKLLQMPNAELAAFIESELERNPLLERTEDLPPVEVPGEIRESEPASAAVEPGDWASNSLESDPVALAQESRHGNRQRLRSRSRRDAFGARASGRRQRSFRDVVDGAGGPKRRRRRARYRGLCRRADQSERAFDPAGDDRAQGARRSHDRERPDRRARRSGLSDGRPRGNRRAPRRSAFPRRRGAAALADPGAHWRLRAQPGRMSYVAVDRARPLRPGDARAHRQLAGAGEAGPAGVAPRLRRRRRGSGGHDRRDQAPRSQARPRIRRRGRAAGDP